jgi:hypothetical protein
MSSDYKPLRRDPAARSAALLAQSCARRARHGDSIRLRRLLRRRPFARQLRRAEKAGTRACRKPDLDNGHY